jgi:hypothetical protein
VAPVAKPIELRILAGHLNGDYTDRWGRIWPGDRYLQGGSVFYHPETFGGERFGKVRYVIPVPPGRYAVTFYFAGAHAPEPMVTHLR